LKLWPGVAEELVGAKAYFIRAGLFRDVDVSLFAHVGANLGASWGGGFGTRPPRPGAAAPRSTPSS
jgi:aminobenzoyl-glutamate utilization protein B